MSMPSAEVHPETSHRSAQPLSLIAFALFGQVFVLAVVMLLLGGGGYLLLTAFNSGWHLAWAIKLGIPMVLAGGATAWTVLRLKPEEGAHIALTRDVDMPLWDMLDEMAEALEAPRVERINITPEFNASASRPARAMPLPWPAPYVVSIGAPLLMLLDKKELKAVLAHELAHHSHKHTSISLMIWRSLANADATLENLNSESLGLPGWLVEKFYRWYAPRLHKMALPYARKHEYEADASAAALVGAETMAQALGAVMGRAAVHHRALRQLKRLVDHGEPLPANPLSTMLEKLRQDPDMQARILVWIRRALRQETDDHDTHPCLRERLAALGFSHVPERAGRLPAQPAMGPLLGETLGERVIAAINGMVAGAFESMAEDAARRRRDLEFRLEKLRTRIQLEGLTGVLASELMATLLDLDRPEEVMEIARRLRAAGRSLEPLHAFQEAVARLHRGEAHAFVQLLELTGRHPWLAEAVVSVAREWLDDDGAAYDTPQLRHELALLEDAYKRCQAAMRDLDKKTIEIVSPEGIALPEEVEEIRQLLKDRAHRVRRAWLVARRCRRSPGWVQLTLVIEQRKTDLLRTYKTRQLKRVMFLAELSSSLPHPCRAAGGLLPWDHPHMTYALSRDVRKKGIRLM